MFYKEVIHVFWSGATRWCNWKSLTQVFLKTKILALYCFNITIAIPFFPLYCISTSVFLCILVLYYCLPCLTGCITFFKQKPQKNIKINKTIEEMQEEKVYKQVPKFLSPRITFLSSNKVEGIITRLFEGCLSTQNFHGLLSPWNEKELLPQGSQDQYRMGVVRVVETPRPFASWLCQILC